MLGKFNADLAAWSAFSLGIRLRHNTQTSWSTNLADIKRTKHKCNEEQHKHLNNHSKNH